MFRLRLGYRILLVTLLIALAIIFFPSSRSEITPIYADASTKTDTVHPVETFVVSSAATTIPAAFTQAGKAYYPEDEVTVVPPLSDGIGGIVTVRRAMRLTIVDGKHSYAVGTFTSTVKDLLAEKKIELGDQDKVSPSLTTALQPNVKITIVRVAITQVTENSSIPFDTIKQNNPNIDQGKTQVSQPGIVGTLASLYQVRREDGVEVSRTLLSTSVVKAPQSQIVQVGTRPVITVACAGYNNTVLPAAIKYNVDPNLLCKGLVIESNGHANSIGGGGTYYGLFQYTQSFWAQASSMCGYAGAAWSDGPTQVVVTACALHKGYGSRWPWA